MYCCKKITKDMYWVGGMDRRLALFENVFPIPKGITYNSYLVLDEKTILLDTVDQAVSSVFIENLEYLLQGKTLNYLVINHMEPDHCATLGDVLVRYPNAMIVGNQMTKKMIQQFFDFSIDDNFLLIQDGETLSTGKHIFQFFMAPMVHWPETMVTFDTVDHILYSADAFGMFGAFEGNFFADEVNFEKDWLSEARRYYANIVGKYGVNVSKLLGKMDELEISMLCPLHGLIWRKNIDWYVEKYRKWSQYLPEETAVMIAYGSVYGNTEKAANWLAMKLSELGMHHLVVYDVASTHPSVLVSEAFRCSHLVFASITYNSNVFSPMETVLMHLKEHHVQNRKVALIENGSWAPVANTVMKKLFSAMKNITFFEHQIRIKSSLKEHQLQEIQSLAEEIVLDIKQNKK